MKKASKPAVKAVLVILVLIICGIGVLSYFNVIDISSILSPTQKEENNIFLETSTESESQDQSTVKTFDDNDYISIPAEEHIAYDENASMVYYDDQLVVYTFSDFSEEDAKKLADLVGGEIVGDISGDINALQIQVEPTELNDLESMANKLMNVDGVMYAGYNYPIQISPAEAITDPWSEDADNPETDLGDEENPDGNDWWAEAIGAYTAWGYSDQCQPIKVGVVDFGFDTEHEDLKGRISFLTDYALNSAADHGTHVAGIIGANGNNGIGLRGVADTADLICVDLVPTDSISYNHTSTIEMIAINKKLIESGAKVVNNSWGISILSETGFEMWLDPELKKQNPIEAAVIKATGAYDRYMEYRVALSKRTGLESTVMMTQLLMSGKEDFLFVQGAGNGYNYYEDGKEIGQGIGCDTYNSGYFCSVNKEIYELLSEPTKEKLAQNGFGYDDIDRRIIIVGAVENQQNNETGYYKMTNFSNFGENVDVCAPGNNVFSTVASDKKYDNYPGTSMAAPMVTGSAALIWSLKPELSAPEVRDILLKNVKTRAYGVGEGEGCEYPMLNVGAAVKAVMGANENSDSVDLTDGYWERMIQSHKAYQFLEDGTVDVYDLNPGEDVVPENLVYSTTYAYQWDGSTLILDYGDGYTTELKPVTKSSDVDWDTGLTNQISQIPDGETFFYETNFDRDAHPLGNAMYLSKAHVSSKEQVSNETPVPTGEISGTPEERYKAFIEARGYEKDWTPESSSGSTWIVDEYDITSYTIFDIDQNGIPELIVCSDPDSSGFSGKIVYTIDPNTDEIVPVTYQGEDGEGCVIISYVSLAYASEYRAIVINRMKNSAMEGHKVLRAIDGVKWSDKDIGEIGYSTDLETNVHTYYSTLSGKRVEMTKEEFDAMFADGGMIQWFEWNEIE